MQRRVSIHPGVGRRKWRRHRKGTTQSRCGKVLGLPRVRGRATGKGGWPPERAVTHSGTERYRSVPADDPPQREGWGEVPGSKLRRSGRRKGRLATGKGGHAIPSQALGPFLGDERDGIAPGGLKPPSAGQGYSGARHLGRRAVGSDGPFSSGEAGVRFGLVASAFGPPEEAVGHRKGWSRNPITGSGPFLGESVMGLCLGGSGPS